MMTVFAVKVSPRAMAARMRGFPCLAAVALAPTLVRAATITANTTEATSTTNGNCSLPEAVQAANTDAVVDACAAGLGTDVIEVPAGTIDFLTPDAANTSFALPPITTRITIQGASSATSILSRNPIAVNMGFFTINAGANLTLKRFTLQNGTGSYGGALEVHGSVTTEDCVFSKDGSDGRGAIDVEGGSFLAKNTTFSGCARRAIEISSYSGGTVTVEGCTFLANKGSAAISNCIGGVVTVKGSTFDQNDGWAIWNANCGGDPSVLDVSDTIFTATAASAINNEASIVTVRRSTFYDNDSGSGAAILNRENSTMTISDSAFYDNRASANGGAIYNLGKTLSITNSTFSNNKAALGGAIYTGGPGDTTLNNVTIAGNQATDSGGGIYYVTGAVGSWSVGNTILAGNTDTGNDSPDCYAAGGRFLTSKGHNLVGNNGGCTILAGSADQVGTSTSPIDAKLAPLGNHGGTTLVRALYVGSPALDKGSPGADAGAACEAADQVGTVRPVGAACDVGAFEGAISATGDGGAEAEAEADSGSGTDSSGSTDATAANDGAAGASGAAGAGGSAGAGGMAGTGGAAGASGMADAGRAGSSGTGGASRADGGGATAGAGDATSDESGGCGCRFAGRGGTGGRGLFFAAAALVLGARRRPWAKRRRSALVGS
jgi:hypothetical protein